MTLNVKFPIIAAIIITLSLLLNINVLGFSVENINVDIPKGYTAVSKDNVDDNLELIEALNFDKISFNDYISKNKIILFAYNQNNTDEITIKKEVGFFIESFDLELLNDESFKAFADSFCAGDKYEKVVFGDNVYICVVSALSDDGGKYYAVEYATIKQGTLYSVDFTFANELEQSDMNLCQAVVSSIDFGKNTSSTGSAQSVNNVIGIVLVVVAIIAVLILAIYIAVTLIVDFRDRRNKSDVAPYVKIKRRKF